MKIGITGTSGTGKTTLAKTISERYGLQLIAGVVRNSPGGQNMMVNEKATALNQICIMSTLAAWSEIDNTVNERTPLDALAHSKPVFNNDQVTFAGWMVGQGMSNYDLIIYCPLYDWERESDPYRSEEYEYLFSIDQFIKDYLDHNKSYFNILIMEDELTEQRMEKIHPYMV